MSVVPSAAGHVVLQSALARALTVRWSPPADTRGSTVTAVRCFADLLLLLRTRIALSPCSHLSGAGCCGDGDLQYTLQMAPGRSTEYQQVYHG